MKGALWELLVIAAAASFAIANDDCSSLWRSSTFCFPVPTPLPEEIRRCYKHDNQTMTFTLSPFNRIILNCEGLPFNQLLIDCSYVKGLYALVIRKCKFPNFTFESYINNKNVEEIRILNDVTSFSITTDLIISSLPALKRLDILGQREHDLFNITFYNLPSLTSLTIMFHKFNYFHAQPFRHLFTLQNLTIRVGEIEMIPEDLFDGLENLRLLDLSFNHIKKIHPSAFKRLTSLLSLHLGYNEIIHINPEYFSDLRNLTELHLEYNNITFLSPGIFQNLSKLKFLDISGNEIAEIIPNAVLNGVTQLREFYAVKCALTTLNETLFFDTKLLRLLDLSRNSLQTLSSGLFENTKYLYHLQINANKIDHIPPKTFRGLSKLKVLRIDFNNLRYLSRRAFVGLSSLTHLDLSHNSLRKIRSSTFDPLGNLEVLNISFNPLITLPSGFPFGKSRYLSIIEASSCLLPKMPNINWRLHNLIYINLADNLISNLTLPVFTTNRIQVHLFDNIIRHITLDFKNISSVSPFYSLKRSSLICDCGLQNFLHFLHSDTQKNHLVFVDADELDCFEEEEVLSDDADKGENGEEVASDDDEEDEEEEEGIVPADTGEETCYVVEGKEVCYVYEVEERILLMDIWPPYKVCPLESKACPPKCHCYLTVEKKVLVQCANTELLMEPMYFH